VELESWRREAREKLELLQAELLETQKQVDATKERLSLLDRLLALEASPSSVASSEVAGKPDDLLDACEAILREIGEPVHIRGLYGALIERRMPIPGRGTEANLIVRLQRSEGRFVRTGRGMYGLPEFGIPEARPQRRRKRSKRK
jgi:hypothetical protein